MQKKIKITVGIPAYNEERNILRLIKDILAQKKKTWELSEIIVVNDASTDGTTRILRTIRSKRVKAIHHSVRRGKSEGINAIFTASRGDLIILFDADERLGGKYVIEKFAKMCRKNPQAMLMGGNKRPFAPQSLLQRGILSTYKVFHKSKLSLKDGNNIFGCQGGCIAVRKEFAKRTHVKKVISDDAYLYLICKKEGHEFRYIDDINVYYKMSGNLMDYLSQVIRSTPKSVSIYLEKHFGDTVAEEFHRPLTFYLPAIITVMLDDPLATLYIVALNILAKPLIPLLSGKYKGYWRIATSTK